MNRKNIFNLNELESLLSNLKNIGIKKFRITGGEPLLHPNILEIINFCDSLDVFTLINTDGSQIKKIINGIKNNSDKIRFAVSLDTLNHSTFMKISMSNVKLSKITQGIHLLNNAGLLHRINTVATKYNNNELKEIIHFCITNKFNLKILDFVPIPNSYSKSSFKETSDLYTNVTNLEQYFSLLSSNVFHHKYSKYYGIPMMFFEINDSYFHIKNSQNNAHFDNDVLCKNCSLYPCQEGLYDIRIQPDGSVWQCRWVEYEPSKKDTIDKVYELIKRFKFAKIQPNSINSNVKTNKNEK